MDYGSRDSLRGPSTWLPPTPLVTCLSGLRRRVRGMAPNRSRLPPGGPWLIWILGFANNRLTIVDFRDVGLLGGCLARTTRLCPLVGRIRARYLAVRLPNPPVRPVRETFASYGSRERDICGKLPFRQLHGIHHGQLARSLATFVPFPHPLPQGLCHVRGFPALDYGLDHGVGHSLLLLYDAKAPNCQKSKDFKGLGHYPCNTILSSFRMIIELQHL